MALEEIPKGEKGWKVRRLEILIMQSMQHLVFLYKTLLLNLMQMEQFMNNAL